MQLMSGLVGSVAVTLGLGGLTVARWNGVRRNIALRLRRYAAAMVEEGTGAGESEGSKSGATGSDASGVFTVGSPRNDAGETGRDEAIMDTDTRAAMAEVMATYGARGAAGAEQAEDEWRPEVDESPIVRMANTILQQAIKERASEIHLEPEAPGLRVRYRIDGILHEIMQIPNYIKQPLTGRYRVLANVDLVEHQRPQFGHIAAKLHGKEYDFQVTFLPTRYGVTTTLRIYDQSSARLGLNKLGFAPEVETDLVGLLARPNGLLLLAGANGSGRGTLAYSLLNRLNTIERNIVTVEERSSFRLHGLTQVYLDPTAGRTLPVLVDALRYQGPDVMLIATDGRAETMCLALEAAQNHLVIITLNAPDAVATLLHLTSVGIDPALIASGLSGVMALRLGRRICPHCKEIYPLDEAEAAKFRARGFAPREMMTIQLARGTGCEHCYNTGYRGRIGFHELLRNSPFLADQIARRASTAELRTTLQGGGLTTFLEDARNKVLQGLTTPEEMLRVGI
jgi:type II secretory ATPase GspE/PulE/Tfp pilus assembly ATPase PilB-like protein